MTNSNDNNDDACDQLIEGIGKVCSGYSVGQILTAMTYIMADAIIQSDTSEDDFLTEFCRNFVNAINEIQETENGDRSYH